MDIFFGETDPRKMPGHFFHGACAIDYPTAIRANTAAQDDSVCPRHWYIDARFRCAKCGEDFLWSAQEQRTWFETYRFWVDSLPALCRDCRAKRRAAAGLRKEYDASVGAARARGTPAQKRRIIEIVDALDGYFGRIPRKLAEVRELFRKQLAEHTLQ